MNEFARDFPIRDGKMFGVYSVAFAANGTVERVAAVDYFLPQGHEQDFAALIRTALRSQQPGAPWSVRVRVEPGAETVFRVGRSEVCEPRSRSSFQLATPAFSRILRPVPMRVQVRIATNGQIRAINILRPSGDNELDRWVQDTLLRRSFQPGLVDGTAVEMEREETVRFTYRP
jgi:TonB family protein